ncbi:MAG: hypothetical protein V7K24_06760 [Nostoc sp.]
MKIAVTQIELGWNSHSAILPFLVLAFESVFWFAFAALAQPAVGIALDMAIQLRWVKPFSSI